MQISDAAAQTGIPASTLRYYETIGLIEPGRSAAGYRDYDPATLERLHAITRAKQVGLALDDIAALLEISAHGSCAQTKSTLRPRLLARLADVNHDALSLLERAEALRATLAHVDTLPDTDEPCRADCALPGSAAAPAKDARASCTLADDTCASRVRRWRAVLGDAPRTPLPDGVRIEVSPIAVGEIVELALAERACCPFLEMALSFGDSSVRLDVHTPPHAVEMLAELFAAA